MRVSRMDRRKKGDKMTNPLRPNSHLLPSGDVSKIRGHEADDPSARGHFFPLTADAAHCNESPLEQMHRFHPTENIAGAIRHNGGS